MKHLVLGSEGQIGYELISYLKSQGYSTLTFDIVADTKQDLRVSENHDLISKIEECDFIHFLAFDVGGSRYLQTYQNTHQFISNNVRLMEYTFELIKRYQKPFIFASSQMSSMSYSPYGVLKALGEFYTRSLNGIVVKFWNVYGLERDLEKAHVITDFILKARSDKKIDMLTDGTEQRQFLHAEDCSRSLLSLATQYKVIDRTMPLHVTSFKWISIMQIAEIIAELYPGTEIFAAASTDKVQQDARNEPDKYILKYWKPQIDLAEGIYRIDKELNDLLSSNDKQTKILKN